MQAIANVIAAAGLVALLAPNLVLVLRRRP